MKPVVDAAVKWGRSYGADWHNPTSYSYLGVLFHNVRVYLDEPGKATTNLGQTSEKAPVREVQPDQDEHGVAPMFDAIVDSIESVKSCKTCRYELLRPLDCLDAFGCRSSRDEHSGWEPKK
jgi:hypothetical protein